MTSFTGEIYVEINISEKPDTLQLKSACEKLLPEISSEIRQVKFHVLQDDKKIWEFIVYKEYIDYKYSFLDTEEYLRKHKSYVDRLTKEKLWTRPDTLFGIWNVHESGFIYLYKENGMLKTQTCHYDGIMQANKDPFVKKVTIDGKEFLKHVWSSDWDGPSEQFYQINEFGDLVFHGPHDFMQYVFEKIEYPGNAELE